VFLKILIVHEIFPPEIAGGGEKLVLRLATTLKERGHAVKVVTSGDPKIKSHAGIETIRIPANRYMMNLAAPIIAKHAADADIIQTSSGNICFPSWIAAKTLNKPIACMVCHIFGPHWTDVEGQLKGRLFGLMEKLFLGRSYDAMVFLNKSSKDIGAKLGAGKKRSAILNPGIDFKKFQMKDVKKEPFVLSVGNFSMNKPTVKIKGFEYIIDAARQMPDTKFVIVGSGEYLPILKRDAPSNVEFLSNLSDRALIRLYNRALVYCAPSLAEGFGFTILEAMASGCAIVSSIDLGQKGKIIKSKSVGEIVKEIKRLMKNPTRAKQIGRQNRKIAKGFTWKKFVDGFEEIYSSLIK
jgi:glycosyltransferase involved in cell wall biosynthesis